MNNDYVTFVVHPPTLDRQDWLAMFKGYKTGDPVGIGDTEQKAMRDLIDQSTRE